MSSNYLAGDAGAIPKGISLSSTVHSEVAQCLPLPSLPVFCGTLDQDLRVVDEPTGSVKQSRRSDVVAPASKIAKLLQTTDVSYLNLKLEIVSPYGHKEHLDLYDQVLRSSSEAFEPIAPDAGGIPKGISLACTVHSEVTHFLPLPSLPVFCDSPDQDLQIVDEPIGSAKQSRRSDVANQASKIATLLQTTDVSYLNLRMEMVSPYGHEEHLDLYDEVLRCNSEAFGHIAPGTAMEQMYNDTVPKNKVSEGKLFVQNLSTNNEALKDKGETQRPHDHDVVTYASRKPKAKKKRSDHIVLPTEQDESERQNLLTSNEALKDKGETQHPHDHDVVTYASRKPKAKKKRSDDIVLPTEQDESERQNLSTSNEALKDKGETQHPHDHDVVTYASRKPKAKKKRSDDILLPTEQDEYERQNLSTSNEALKDKGETQHPHDHDVVTYASRKPKAKKKTSDDIVLPTEQDESERQNISTNNEALKDKRETQRPYDHDVVTYASRKPKAKKKTSDDIVLSTEQDEPERQDASVERFCEVLEDLCGKAEISVDDREEGEAEWLVLHVSNIKSLVKEVMLIRAKNLLHLVPVAHLERTLKILDHHIQSAEGLSITQSENSISDVMSSILVALESIHVATGIMACSGMPNQIYKEEIIERIVELSRRQIADVMSVCDPNYLSTNKPTNNGSLQDEDNDDYVDYDEEFRSASKRRRTARSVKVKKNRAAAAAHNILQKLCTILGFLKDLLVIEPLSDSCILQLVKTCFSTLNLPEYPASTHILEVLCVSLLQNAGLKSKDIAARTIAIEILGTVAVRLKEDAILCKKEKFWIVQELRVGDDIDDSHPDDVCSVCLEPKIENPLVQCKGCERLWCSFQLLANSTDL